MQGMCRARGMFGKLRSSYWMVKLVNFIYYAKQETVIGCRVYLQSVKFEVLWKCLFPNKYRLTLYVAKTDGPQSILTV